jgi:hypothetical protein
VMLKERMSASAGALPVDERKAFGLP